MPTEPEALLAMLPRLLQAMGRGGRVAGGLVRPETNELVHATPELELLLSTLNLPRHGLESGRWLVEGKPETAGVQVEKLELSSGTAGWLLVVARPTHEVQMRVLVEQVARRYSLSPSEQREVEHLAKGLSIKDSAAQLQISPETVRVRRKRVYRKMRITGHESLLTLLCREALAPPRARETASR